jgi:hypothetical protein
MITPQTPGINKEMDEFLADQSPDPDAEDNDLEKLLGISHEKGHDNSSHAIEIPKLDSIKLAFQRA